MNKIVETFVSIQGEGSLQGTNMLFIRFFGCNLKCPWCDEPKHTDKKFIRIMLDDELVNLALSLGTEWVNLTGGEISINDMNPLIKKFHKAGFKVQVESNGYQPLNIMSADWKTCSPKDSAGKIPDTLSGTWDEIKLVVQRHDNAFKYVPAYMQTGAKIYVQPCNYEHTINWDNMDYALELIKEFPKVGLSPQLHKLLEVD